MFQIVCIGELAAFVILWLKPKTNVKENLFIWGHNLIDCILRIEVIASQIAYIKVHRNQIEDAV